MIDILISLIVAIISQYIHISKHQIVYHKCIQFSFLSYTLIKIKKEIRIFKSESVNPAYSRGRVIQIYEY